MSALDRAMDRARAQKARVVFPEFENPSVEQATIRMRTESLCVPMPLAPVRDAHIAALVKSRGLKEPIAKRMLSKPLYRAAAMVAAGEADAMVAGIDSPTKRVIEAASIGIGLADGVTLASSFFLMLFPDGRELIFADCGVTVAPDADALCAIATQSQRSAQALLGRGQVALLSFSTGDSGAGPSVDMVRQVAHRTGFLGPIQGDAALNPMIGAKKGMGDGGANVLIFPSLDAGNIAYKLCQELAGAQALGPVLQGFAKPVCDLSRGASADDIVAATAVTLALASTT